jgi:benzoyl-CoA reductase/2-hydroxyglutaryl-CoA dehydratase subunit BcrC/BadD/HgdB
MSNTQLLNPLTDAETIWQNYQRKPLPSIQKLFGLATSYTFRDAEEAVKEGKNAIWGGTSWELPLILACDTIPISLLELWRDDSHHTEAIAEGYFQIPNESCSMIKTMIGRLHERKDTEKIKRILAFNAVCEPISIVLELVRQEGYDVHLIEAVSTFKDRDKTPEVIEFVTNELQKVAVWLTGKPVDEARLSYEIHRKNEISAKLKRVLELRTKTPLDVPGHAVLLLMLGSFSYYGDAVMFSNLLDEIIVDLEEAINIPDPRPYIPLVLAGFFLGDYTLYKAVESSHGAIVGWEFGTRDYREDVPPLESIAHFLLDSQLAGQYGEMVGAAVQLRKFDIARIVEETGARGILSGNVTGCPYGSIVPQLERLYFKKLGIPYISLETSVHQDPPTEEQITRIKAFVEMLTQS